MEYLEATVDKFIFRVPKDCIFSPEGIWFHSEPGPPSNRWRIGLTDFLQQHSGDLTFAILKPQGTRLAAGDEIGVVETVKVNVSLISPVAGTMVEVNSELEMTPELINQDPYGKGWLAMIEASPDDDLAARLMTASAYFEHMKVLAEAEVRSR
ncbi:MAG: glycine cleavage system protein H [Candidatus Aminicenantes bacterium]|nr:glycine cleavage system protein H [Candidatus Aminicenantes bacterium]